MDKLTQLENAIKFASQNPTDPKSVQLKTAIQSGKYNTELEQLKTKNNKPVVAPVAPPEVPQERNTIQKVLGAFLDPIIESGVYTGEAVGGLLLKGANAISGGALDKYSKTGNLDTSISDAVNKNNQVPVLGTEVTPADKITPENTAGRAVSTVALGVNSPAVAGALLTGGEAMQQDKGAVEVALNTVVGAIGGKILEHGFNAVAPFIEKAVAKYGTPIIEKLQQYIPESAKGFMDNLASKLPDIANKELPKPVSSAIAKGEEILNKTIDKPLEAGFQKSKEVVTAIKDKVAPTQTSDELAGMIGQGKTSDIATTKRTLESLDTTGITTQKELSDKIASEIKPLAEKVDAELAKDTIKKPLKSLVLEEKTSSGKVVKTNYVDEALSNLKELYQKTGDNVSATEIADLIKLAKKEGLTYKQVNDISRNYNVEFGNKAFSKVSGDPLTSINAQKFENVRSGLKKTARQGLGGEEAKYLDSRLSDLYDTKKLIDKQVEKVNAESQKTSKTGFIQTAVRKIIKTADVLTGSPLKAIAKEVGLKESTMSALEIEKRLKKGLEIIKKNKGLNESQIEEKLMEVFKDVQQKLTPVKVKTSEKGTSINVGLNTNDGGTITDKLVTEILKKEFKVNIVKSAIHQSGTEPTFVAKLSRKLTDEELYKLTEMTKQDAIPQLSNGFGKMTNIGKESWGDFNPKYFMNLEGKTIN